MKAEDLSVELDGERYFTVKGFAEATHKSEQSVRFLMSYGNRIRRLKVVYKVGKPLIPYAELLEFPFTSPGRGVIGGVYHFDENCQQVAGGEA